MAIKIKQVISEEIIKKDKKDINLDRIHQLAGITKQKEVVKPILESAEFIKLGPDNNVYAIVKDKGKYWIKKAENSETLNESSFDYLYGLQNQSKGNGFSSYGSALKSLNLIFKDIHEQNGVLLEQTLFMEDDRRKFVLKFQAPKKEVQTPVEPEKKKSDPEPVDFPEPFADNSNDELPDEFPMDDNIEQPTEEPQSNDSGDDQQSEEPVKEIQKLTGKLGQQLRDNKDVVDEDIVKYVMNSMLSAIDIGKLSDAYREELISKIDKNEKDSEEKQIEEEFNSKLEELRIADRINETIRKSLKKLLKEQKEDLNQKVIDFITERLSNDEILNYVEDEIEKGNYGFDDLDLADPLIEEYIGKACKELNIDPSLLNSYYIKEEVKDNYK